MPGSDDDIIVRAILTDELSDPVQRVIAALNELDAALNEARGGHDELTDAQDRNTDSTERNTRETRRNNQERDAQGRWVRRNKKEIEEETEAKDKNDKETTKLTKSTTKLTKSLFKLNKIQKLLLFSGLIFDLMAQASTGVAALGAAAYAAVAGLSPLVGTLLPIPAILGGIAMWGGTAFLAFGGLGKAISAFNSGDIEAINEATKDMGPNTKDAAFAFAELNKQFKPLKQMVQEKVFEGFGDTIANLGQLYFPLLEDSLGRSADGFRTTLGFATGFFELPQTVAAMNRILGDSVQISELFGHTLNGVLRATIHLMDAAGPTAVRMMTGLSDGVNNLADKIYQNQARIGDFADRAYDLWLDVKKVIIDISMALYNTGRMSMDLANSMGTSFGDMIARWRAWTESTEGQVAIKKFFDDMRPNIEAIGRLIVALAKGFNEIGRSPNFAGIMDQLSAFIPTLVDIILLTDGEFVPAVITIIDSIARVAAGMNIWGPLGIILQGIAIAIKAIADAFVALPDWVQSAAGLALTFALWWRWLGTLGRLLRWVTSTAIWRALQTAIMWVARTLFTMLIRPLLAFLFTNPIGWIILSVMLLVGAFVLLWKKSEKFRDIVKAIGQWFVDTWNNTIYPTVMRVWEWMKDAWDKTREVVMNVVGAVVEWFKGKWDQIKFVIQVMVIAAVMYFKLWWLVVSTVVMAIWNVIKTVFNVIKTIVMTVVNVFISYWNLIFPIVKGVVDVIVAYVKLAFNLIKLAIAIVIFIVGALFMGFVWVAKLVINNVVNLWNAGWQVVSTIVRIAIDVIKAIIGFLLPIAKHVIDSIVTVWNAGWNIVSTVVSFVVNLMKTYISFVIDHVKNVMNLLISIWSTGWNAVSGFVSSAIDKVRNFLSPVVSHVQQVMSKVKGVWESIWNAMSNFVKGIIDRISSLLGGIASRVSSIADGIGNLASTLSFGILAAGGPVAAGSKNLVGEIGPEAFVSSSGRVKGIGMHGPEFRDFGQSGYVVPHHVLATGINDGTVPTGVMKRLENAMASGGGNAFAGAPTRRGNLSSNTYMQGGGNGGSNHYDFRGANFGGGNAGDVKKSVKQAIEEADRNRRERG